MPILRSSLMAATGAAALAACASAAQQRIEPSPNAGLQTGQAHDITVRQIPQETGSPSQTHSVEQLDQGETPRPEASPMPGDAENLPTATLGRPRGQARMVHEGEITVA